MGKGKLVLFLVVVLSSLLAYDYDSGIIDVRTDPLASGGEIRFLPYYISVCVDQPPLIVDLNLPPGDYTVDAYLRYYPCEQENETMDASLGDQTEHMPDMGCTSFRWFYNIGSCGANCGGDPSPLNYHTTVESADLVFQGSGWTAEGVNIIYVRVQGNYHANHPPVVTELIPSEGEFADDIEISATSSDPDSIVVSEEYEYSVDGETWLPIAVSDDPEASIIWTSELNECEVWLRARAYDGDLYSEWFQVGPILIDNTPPVTTDDAPDTWQTGEVTVTLTPDDGECGSGFDGTGTTYYGVDVDFTEGTEIVLSGTGIHEYFYFSVDDVGNEELLQTFTVMIDDECPVFADWSIPEIDEDYEGGLPVSVTVTDEHSGLLDYDQFFAFGDAETPASETIWEIFTGEITAVWADHEGEYLYVKAVAEDNAGNVCEEEAASEFIDPVNHPPIITALTPTEGEFADNIVISAETEDPDGPVLEEHYEYSLDGDIWTPIVETDEVLLPYSWASGLNECEVWLRARAYDGEFYSDWFEVGPILIDNTPPVTTDNAPEGWQNTDVTVTLTPDDGVCGSGFDGTGTTFYGFDVAFEEGTEVTFTETGIHELFYYSVDDVGNEEALQTFTVIIDKDCPVFTDWSVPEINEDYDGRLPISVTVTDEHSGLLEYNTYFAFGDVATPGPTGIIWTIFMGEVDVDWTLHENQYLYIKAVGEDNAGNVCHSDIQTEYIEHVNHPPIITALMPGSGEFADDIIISAETSDPDGPVASEEFHWSTDGDTWHTIGTSDPETDYSWASGLNECEVYIRARAFDGELYSGWFIVGPILIDNTAPITTDDAPTGWQSGEITITLTSDDGVCGSGFDGTGTTYFSIDGGEWIEGTEVIISGSGTHNVQYYSVDDVGNTESVEGFVLLIDDDCVVFDDWTIPDLTGGFGTETCITYTGRDGIHYDVVVGLDPTCGLAGIKFEDAAPGLGEDSELEADIFQFTVPTTDIPAVLAVATKAGGVCGYTSFAPTDCAAAIEAGGICEEGPDEGGFTVQLIDMVDLGDGTTQMTWRVVSDDVATPALSHVIFAVMPDGAPTDFYTIPTYEICFGGGDIAECDTFYGRDGIDYTVEMGTDPTCGLTGIKFEDGEPGLGEDGAIEGDLFRFTTETLPTYIEVSTKAARTCGYTVFSTATCGVLTGEGGICEEGPDEGGFVVQLLHIDETELGYEITFRVLSTDETPHALSHVTFGLDDVLPMSAYSTPGILVFCDESTGPSCETFSFSITDEVSGVDVDETGFSYAWSPDDGIEDPADLTWTNLVTGGEGTISFEICETWSEHSGYYIYFLAEGQDLAGNSCSEMVSEYVDPVTVATPTFESCGRGATLGFPTLLRLHNTIGYNVYRAASPDGPFTRVNSEPVVIGTFKDEPPRGRWFYKVTRVLSTLEEIPFGGIFEVTTYDVVTNSLTPELLPGAKAMLTWHSVPEVTQYVLYGGTSYVDYEHPLATLYSDTTWTTPAGLLSPGSPYTFSLRVNSSCGCTDGEFATTINITPAIDPAAIAAGRAIVTSPAPGAKVTGDFLTLAARPLTPGDLSLVSVRFQIRPAGTYIWTDLTPAVPYGGIGRSNENPDNRKPFYINFDTAPFGRGRYEIRAMGYSDTGRPDHDPVITTFDIDREPLLTEKSGVDCQHIRFTAPPNRVVPVILGAGYDNVLINAYFFVIGSGAVELKMSHQPDSALPEMPFVPLTAFRTDKLAGFDPDNVITALSVNYDQSRLTAIGLDESELALYRFTESGTWENPDYTLYAERDLVTAQVEGFGLYVLGTVGLLEVSDHVTLPEERELLSAHPNPFNSSVMISAFVPDHASELAVYNVLGEKLTTLSTQETGFVSIAWDGRDSAGRELPSGVYLVRLEGQDKTEIKRLILLR